MLNSFVAAEKRGSVLDLITASNSCTILERVRPADLIDNDSSALSILYIST